MDLERIATLALLASISIFIAAVAIRMGGRRPRSTATGSLDGAELADEYAGAGEPEGPLEEYGYADADEDGYGDGSDSGKAGDAKPDHETGIDADAGEILLEQDSDEALVQDEERPSWGEPGNPGHTVDGGVDAVAAPYCYRCSRGIDPYRKTCPKCGSPVRFRFLGRGMPTAQKKQDESGYVRPSWRQTS